MAVRRDLSDKSATPDDSFQKKLFEYGGAASAWKELCDQGLTGIDLEKWLVTVTGIEILQRRRPSPVNRLRVAGMPLYTLERLPERLRTQADEIAHINTEIQTAQLTRSLNEVVTELEFPVEWRAPSAQQRKETLEQFQSIPALLKGYADYLQLISLLFKSLLSELRPRVGGLREAFVLWVHEKTGEPQYSKLATLLNAACCAFAVEGCDLDPHALAVAYGRSKLIESLQKMAKADKTAEELRDLVFGAFLRVGQRDKK